MLITKPNNYGIDSKINEIQRYLDSKLSSLWAGDIGIYGRLEELSKGFEVYIAENEYKQPFFNDKQSASIAFEVTNYDSSTNLKADLRLICTCLLSRIYPLGERDDQKAMLQLYNLLKRMLGVLEFDTFETGLEVTKSIGIKTTNREMHPWFVFAINFKVVYKNNVCLI